MGGRGDPNRTVYSDGGFFYPTEIEPIAGDCDLRDDFYGKRGLEEILNFSSVNPSAPTSVSRNNKIIPTRSRLQSCLADETYWNGLLCVTETLWMQSIALG